MYLTILVMFELSMLFPRIHQHVFNIVVVQILLTCILNVFLFTLQKIFLIQHEVNFRI